MKAFIIWLITEANSLVSKNRNLPFKIVLH